MSDHTDLIIDRAHAFMLIGPIGAGKTTLFNALFGRPGEARKTQAVEYEADLGVDTPGEFFDHPRLHHALICTAADVGTLVYVQGADDFDCRMPPGLMEVYGHKRLIAVITKIDLPTADADRVEALLRVRGIAGPVFRVSVAQPSTLEPLRAALATGRRAAGRTRTHEAHP
ncbi:EutP/PduV family microcompartment system protein [Pseudothauera rhizosphaerae]|uniref:Ethanolamine utilization protein EutP n=1 Tax=Pseudothauera rhizosphaerae TaxID=2565932 RepID=A0A4S4AJ35_9RHOO|nr:EutP/PduV family microcompartment system protein [Pseudothauera rhizosphaerae]THF59302.1 ethanolamine utilization protein EutP [Pseudothauera rhizosphaerae]